MPANEKKAQESGQVGSKENQKGFFQYQKDRRTIENKTQASYCFLMGENQDHGIVLVLILSFYGEERGCGRGGGNRGGKGEDSLGGSLFFGFFNEKLAVCGRGPGAAIKEGDAVFFYMDNGLAGSFCLGQEILGNDGVRGQAEGQGIPGGIKGVQLGLAGFFDAQEEQGGQSQCQDQAGGNGVEPG